MNRASRASRACAPNLPDSIERHDYIINPNFAPVLARIEELNLPIIFHQMDGIPNNYGADRVSGPPNLAAGLDAPTDHTVLATKLMMSGILDKYPKLEIVLPHAGGAFPYLAGRIEHFFSHFNDQRVPLARPFREYLRRFYYDYLIYYPGGVPILSVTMVGTDRIVVGTDIFAAQDVQYPSLVLDQPNYPAAERERILKGNAIKAFASAGPVARGLQPVGSGPCKVKISQAEGLSATEMRSLRPAHHLEFLNAFARAHLPDVEVAL